MVVNAPRISVVVCTHNRVQYLEGALDSLREQSLATSDFEVLVVDNASTDATREAVEKYRSLMPNLRYVYEERLGLSWARNSGAEACRSPYVVFLDDDARAFTSWLRAILDAFETASPTPACLGGPVRLDWEGSPPGWLPTSFHAYYSHVDWGLVSRFLVGKEHLVGANFAFRREVLAQLGGFSTELGRKGSSLLSGEESELLDKVRERGLPIFYAAEAEVWHTVPRRRQSRSWFFPRVYWAGVSGIVQDQLRAGKGGRGRGYFLRAAFYDFRWGIRFALFYVLRLMSSRDARFPHLVEFVKRLGRLRTHLLLAWGVRVAG